MKPPSTLHVCFDCDIYSLQDSGGIRRYFTCLSKALSDLDPNQIKVLNPGLHWDNSPSTRLNPLYGGIKLLRLAASFLNPLVRHSLCGNNIVYHPTYYRNLAMKYMPVPKVITIHDMIHELKPDWFSAGYRLRIPRYIWLKKQAIIASDLIVAVSETTKSDLLQVYPRLDREKIVVVYHGSDHLLNLVPLMPSSPVFGDLAVKSCPLILHVGKREHYKGFEDLAVALEILVKAGYDFKLFCIGSPFSAQECHSLANRSLLAKATAAAVTDSEAAWLYLNAAVTVNPSWYEGFGLPILEAMTMGSPVVCANNKAHLEVGNGYADTFPFGDSRALADVLSQYLTHPMRGSRRVRDAMAYSRGFTWGRTAHAMANLYREIV